MWVKKSREEQQKVITHENFMKFIGPLVGAVLFSLMITFTRGGTDNLSRFFLTPNESLQRIPTALIFGILYYILIARKTHKESTLVCPICGSVKKDNGKIDCECGGHYEDIKTMKWIND